MTKDNDPFEPFKTREDYGKWEHYIKQCGFIRGLSTEYASKATHAIEQLRESLGDDVWLTGAFYNGHPILYDYLFNATAWSRAVLIRIAHAIKALQGKEGFARLIDGLRDPYKFRERESVLEAAHRFHRVCFDVTFDPHVRIRRRDGSEVDKEPDMKITDRLNKV